MIKISQGNQGKSFFIMFDVVEGGIVEPIEFKKDSLTPDRSIIVMDEENQTVWLWHGARRALVPRRMALRQAQSLKGHGYQAGNAIVGRDLNTIVEIDDRKVGREPATTEDNDKFLVVLNNAFENIGNFVYIKKEGNAGGITIPKVEEKVSKPVEPAPLKSVVKDLPPIMPSGKLAKPIMTDDLVKGAVVMAVLTEFKDVWISKKENGVLSLEQMDGKICSFSVEDGEILMLPGSFFEIPMEKKEAIEKLIEELQI